MKVSLIPLLIAIHTYLGVKFNKEFRAFSCSTSKKPLSVNLKYHRTMPMANSFTAAFWFKYKYAKNVPIMTVETFGSNISLSIDELRRLKVSNSTSSTNEILPSASLTDFQTGNSNGGWNFLTFSFRSEGSKSDRAHINYSLNFKQTQGFYVETQLDLRKFRLTLGGDNFESNCAIEALYYDLILFNKVMTFTQDELHGLSTGILQPVFLTKFDNEGSYNKIYTNLVNSGIGDMRNGSENSVFTLFTSLSTTKNTIKRQSNLVNDLGTFFLPKKMLPFYKINSSYTFVIQYDFFYKDYSQATYENVYYHALYQRIPDSGVNKLIRADFQMIMNPNDANAYLRFIVNDEVKKQSPYLLTLGRSNGLRSVPFNYLIVKVVQTSLNPNPVITFINGYDDSTHVVKANFILGTDDQHTVGDFNQADATRKEFLSFISINEIAFYTGAFVKMDTHKNSPANFYSGYGNDINVLTCRTNNNPLRHQPGTPKQLILDSCDTHIKESKLISL